MNIKFNLKDTIPIISYFFKKKSDLENLKKDKKAHKKKYLDFYETCLITKNIHDCDKHVLFNVSKNEDLNHLRKNGFVKLSKIKFKFDEYKFNKILDDKNLSVHDEIGVASVIDSSKHFPELNQILESDYINNICKSYLGSDASVNHIRVERLEQRLSRNDVSGLYHHDMVGHRLKILILLDDVSENGRCTSYTVGTHKIKWKNYDYDQSRYDSEIVEKKFKISKFHGKRGDIFIFDTNGLHKRDENPDKSKRAVVFIDIASHNKCQVFKQLIPDKIPHIFPIGYYREQYFDKNIDIEKTLLKNDKIKFKNNFYFYESD
tara:strand:+ start:1931 stop:2887 length:957 start_codon:yes stop_codon:yes gene_type:complete